MAYLKACPFCGNDVAPRLDQTDKHNFSVVCSMIDDESPVPTPGWKMGCGGHSGYRQTAQETIEAWNNRASILISDL